MINEDHTTLSFDITGLSVGSHVANIKLDVDRHGYKDVTVNMVIMEGKDILEIQQF